MAARRDPGSQAPRRIADSGCHSGGAGGLAACGAFGSAGAVKPHRPGIPGRRVAFDGGGEVRDTARQDCFRTLVLPKSSATRSKPAVPGTRLPDAFGLSADLRVHWMT